MVSAKDPRERRLLASQTQGALRQIETDIELAHYEPASIRRSAAWLASRQQVVENSQYWTRCCFSVPMRTSCHESTPGRAWNAWRHALRALPMQSRFRHR
jgi:hypothetical protein